MLTYKYLTISSLKEKVYEKSQFLVISLRKNFELEFPLKNVKEIDKNFVKLSRRIHQFFICLEIKSSLQ